MPEFTNAHTAIRRLLDAIESYEQALRTEDLDPAVLETVVRSINESQSDSKPKLEASQIPSYEELCWLRFRELEAPSRDAEEAIKPITRQLTRLHGLQPVKHAGIPAPSWSHWVIKLGGLYLGARVWASLGGPDAQPKPMDAMYIKACLGMEYAALAESVTAAIAADGDASDVSPDSEAPPEPPSPEGDPEQSSGSRAGEWSEYHTPAEWQETWQCSGTTWRKHRDALGAGQHPTSGSRRVRFRHTELQRLVFHRSLVFG